MKGLPCCWQSTCKLAAFTTGFRRIHKSLPQSVARSSMTHTAARVQEYVDRADALPPVGSLLPIIMYRLDMTQYELPPPRTWVKLRNIGALQYCGQLLVCASPVDRADTCG